MHQPRKCSECGKSMLWNCNDDCTSYYLICSSGQRHGSISISSIETEYYDKYYSKSDRIDDWIMDTYWDEDD